MMDFEKLSSMLAITESNFVDNMSTLYLREQGRTPDRLSDASATSQSQPSSRGGIIDVAPLLLETADPHPIRERASQGHDGDARVDYSRIRWTYVDVFLVWRSRRSVARKRMRIALAGVLG
jgi:hypothetical protein